MERGRRLLLLPAQSFGVGDAGRYRRDLRSAVQRDALGAAGRGASGLFMGSLKQASKTRGREVHNFYLIVWYSIVIKRIHIDQKRIHDEPPPFMVNFISSFQFKTYQF